PLPIAALEAASRPGFGARTGKFAFDRLELGADSVAEFGEPHLGHQALAGVGRKG
ncbi:MAG: hypothetical protein JO095_07420, partial [Alphaproteobacteria bacterium]|nr:hypothetical protein [Alphaproteobacteria bacterium]